MQRWPRCGPLIATASCGILTLSSLILGAGAGAAPQSVRAADDHTNIFVVPTEGGRPVRLTNNGHGGVLEALEETLALDPSWSPDGKRLVFTEIRCHSCSSEIHVMRAKPTRGKTWLRGLIGHGYHPRWSPNGQLIAYVRTEGGIYVMRPDGSHKRRVTRGGLADDGPAWSPNSRQIVFTRQVTATRWRLYVVGANGTGLRPLTSGRIPAINPSWSPNGRRIAFARELGNWQIFTMNLRGRGRKRISNGRTSDSFPVWSPDGQRLVFVRQEGSATAVFTVKLNGRGLRRMSPRPMNAVQPTWSPNGRRVAFAGTPRE